MIPAMATKHKGKAAGVRIVYSLITVRETGNDGRVNRADNDLETCPGRKRDSIRE